MDMETIVQLVLAAGVGAVIYALVVRALPGRQPAEDLVDKILGKLDQSAQTLNDAATRQVAAANIMGRAAAVQVAAAPQAAPVASASPAPAAASPAAVPEPAAAPAPSPATAPTWQEPPAPWPIDARFLNPAQIAALSPDAQRRSVMWSQSFMSAARQSNGQDPTGAALLIYRASFLPSSELGNPLTPIWQQIFAAYGVLPPAPAQAWPTYVPQAYRPGEEAYDVRAQGYSADKPYVTQPEQP